MTLDKAMLKVASDNPERIPYQDPFGKVTAGELAVASYLLGQYIPLQTSAERIGICLPSTIHYPIALFGTLMAGKTAVPLNFFLQPHELEFVLKDAEVDLVITTERFEKMFEGTSAKALNIEDLHLLNASSQPTPVPAREAASIAVLLYTSGTTAMPKGVQLSHPNFLHQARAISAALNTVMPSSELHLISALPFFHSFALTVCMMLPALTQARVSILPQFEPTKTLKAISHFGANTLLAVPSMHRMLARAAKKEGKRAADYGLKLAVAGSERLPPEVRVEFEDAMGIPLLEGYGLSEHSPVVSVNLPNANKPGTLGKALPTVEWRIADPSTDKALPDGEEGEIQVWSPSVMVGYHNATEPQPITEDGYLKTGDLGIKAADGYVTMTGRIKELIISAGKNIHPSEIESVFDEHEQIEECAVISMPDKTRGEAPACFIVPVAGATLTSDELREWIKDKVADYKMPRLIRVMKQPLPRGPTGKVSKRTLIKMFMV